MHGASMQHEAIFEKKSVLIEEGSLDHVRFMRMGRGVIVGTSGKLPELPPSIPMSSPFLPYCLGSECKDG